MFRKSLEEVLTDKSPKVLIDLRKPEDYRKETIPGSVNIYYRDFQRYVPRLPKDKRIYLFCYTGETSDEMAEQYRGKGYDVYSIEKGYHSYLRYKLRQMRG